MTTAFLLDETAFDVGERLLDAGGREWRIEDESVDADGQSVLRVRLRFHGEELSAAFDMPLDQFVDLARRTRMRPWPMR
jgi:hypothetical protein